MERATQTYNKMAREKEMQTEPPRKIRFKTNLNQWLIYDRYVAVEEAKELAEKLEGGEEVAGKKIRRKYLEDTEDHLKEITNTKMIRCAKGGFYFIQKRLDLCGCDCTGFSQTMIK